MTDVDARAATEAWLARLPASERLAAQAHTDARLVVWLGADLVVALAAFALSRSGLLARLRRRIEAPRPRPWLTSAVLAGVTALAVAGALALYDALSAGWEGVGAGAAPHLAARLGEAMASVPSSVGAAVLIAPPLLALTRWRPHRWPWIAGAAFVVACLALGWGPYVAGSTAGLEPAPAGPVRDGLLRLAADAGMPTNRIWLSPDPGFDADVTGGFGRDVVIVGRPVLGWPPAEARAYVGHLMGHHAHGDVFVAWLIWGLAGLVGALAFSRWGAALARGLGARGVRGPGDPEALPAAAIVLTLALGLGALATNGYLRWANVRADAYSLAHAREPDGLAAVIEREWDHESVDPNPIERAVFYSHPPLAERLAHAMAWKAAHGGR